MAVIQDFRVRKGLVVSENADIVGNTNIQQRLTVTNTASFSNTLSVTGATTLSNTVGVTGAATFSNNINVTGVATFGSSNATFDTNVLSIDATNNRVGVNTSLGQTVAFVVTGDANVIGNFVATNITATANVTATSLTVTTGNSIFDSGVLFVDSLNNRVGVNNTTPDASLTVTGTANVAGAVRIGGTLNTVLAGFFANTISVTGATTLSNTVGVTGAATFANTVGITGTTTATTINATNVTVNRIVAQAGASNGFAFPDNAFGGTGDTASMTLENPAGGEAKRMTFRVGNDPDDLFSFIAPSNNGMLMNGFTVWHAGNDGAGSGLDADFLDGFTQSVNNDGNTIVRRDASGNFSAGTISATLNGQSAGSNSLLYGGGNRSATEAATGLTIMARDGNGDTFARFFRGTATSSLYADLAEKYLADAEYKPGTVIAVGGSKEVTAATEDNAHSVIGVVSTAPAHLMNDGLEGGTAIALKGRVPVLVSGPVSKGNRLTPSNQKGVAIAYDGKDKYTFAIALETSVDYTTKLIEAVIL